MVPYIKLNTFSKMISPLCASSTLDVDTELLGPLHPPHPSPGRGEQPLLHPAVVPPSVLWQRPGHRQAEEGGSRAVEPEPVAPPTDVLQRAVGVRGEEGACLAARLPPPEPGDVEGGVGAGLGDDVAGDGEVVGRSHRHVDLSSSSDGQPTL